jgi:hypothetical protein
MKLNHQFVQEDLDKLVASAAAFYKSREDTPREAGAIVLVSGDAPLFYLQNILALAASGYNLHESLPIHQTSSYCCAYMTKPESQQKLDIEAIKVKVEADYRETLKARYEAHVDAIVAETLQRAERTELKKAETAKEKLIAQARKEALAALGEFEAC